MNKADGKTPRIITPWTEDQVRNLNEWQAQGHMHPFTCGNVWCMGRAGYKGLEATPDGWWCRWCTYRQEWAYAFMAMSENMVLWGVDCAGCANLLDKSYEEYVRADKAENRVVRLTAKLKAMGVESV